MTDRKLLATLLKQTLGSQTAKLRLALVCAALGVAVFVLQSAILAQLIGAYLQAWQTPEATQQPIDLLRYLPSLFICLLARPSLQFFREHLSQSASHQARKQLRRQLLSKLSQLGPERHAIASDGALSARLLEQIDALDGYISRYYVQLYLVLLTPVLLLAATAYYSWLAAGLLLLTAPLVPLFMILVGGAAAKSSQQQMAAMSQLSGRFLDFVRGMPTLQHFRATQQAQTRIAHSAEQYRIKTMSVLKLAFLSGAVLELFSALAVALVAVYLGMGLLGMLPWAKGEVPVAYTGALFILLLAPEFYAPLRQLGSDYHAKAEAEGAIEELLPLLTQPELATQGQQLLQQQVAPTINLKQVAVQGADARQRLAAVDLTLAAGERVLLQGESGIGKSSLLMAVMGFVAYQGEITIDQQELQQLERANWQSKIGYLSQQPAFKQATIAENLRLANPQASTDALWQALQQVQLKSLIEQLPDGINTLLGERGAGLSGGQLGRLAIAQLLLRDPQLWLLDEPNAHLDPDTQLQINQLLAEVTQGKTVIVVSHTQQGFAWVDRIEQLIASEQVAA